MTCLLVSSDATIRGMHRGKPSILAILFQLSTRTKTGPRMNHRIFVMCGSVYDGRFRVFSQQDIPTFGIGGPCFLFLRWNAA